VRENADCAVGNTPLISVNFRVAAKQPHIVCETFGVPIYMLIISERPALHRNG